MKKLRTPNYCKLTGLLLFLLISSGVFAQTNFSGKWVFNQTKSKIPERQDAQGGGGPGGPGGPMGGGDRTVTQDEKLLTVNQTMQSPDGETPMTNKYNLDGSVSENTFVMDMKRKSTLTWSADKKSITIVSKMVLDMGGDSREIKESETWKLSDDGKTLFIETTMPGGPGGPGAQDGGQPGGQPGGGEGMKITMVYDKK
jgi:hypothetical protein